MMNHNPQKIALISAMSANRVIGRDNKLPWTLPADWENFRRVTHGKPFVMGRKSYESKDALISDYRNVILSRRPELELCDRCLQARSISEALQLLADEPVIFILGGANIFEQTLPLANYLYLTIVHHTFEGDAFFPAIDLEDWKLVRSAFHPADDRHAYAFSMNEYVKKV